MNSQEVVKLFTTPSKIKLDQLNDNIRSNLTDDESFEIYTTKVLVLRDRRIHIDLPLEIMSGMINEIILETDQKTGLSERLEIEVDVCDFRLFRIWNLATWMYLFNAKK
jgi:hypothetical protein